MYFWKSLKILCSLKTTYIVYYVFQNVKLKVQNTISVAHTYENTVRIDCSDLNHCIEYICTFLSITVLSFYARKPFQIQFSAHASRQSNYTVKPEYTRKQKCKKVNIIGKEEKQKLEISKGRYILDMIGKKSFHTIFGTLYYTKN